MSSRRAETPARTSSRRDGGGRPGAPCRASRTALAALAGLALVVALSACGSKEDALSAPSSKHFTVMLDFFPNADHAPLYTGISHGDFRTVGLNVVPEAPADPSEPLKLLAAGRVDMAISYEPEVLLARDAGLNLVAIGALVQRPLTSILALPGKHVTSVASLAGKRVGTAGIPYQAAMLHTALEHAGAKSPAREVNVGFNLVPAMISGRVDATLGGFWNYEAIQLQLEHRHPRVIPVDEAGVPSYNELVIVVRADVARKDAQDLRAFMQALTQGAKAVRADPAAGADAVLAANPSLPRKLQLESIKQTLPATLPSEAGKPYGWQSPQAWATFGSWMFSHGLLKHDPNTTGFPPFTNEFLPGQGI